MKLVLATLTLMLAVSQANAQTKSDIDAAQREARGKQDYVDTCSAAFRKGSPEVTKADADKSCSDSYDKAFGTKK